MLVAFCQLIPWFSWFWAKQGFERCTQAFWLYCTTARLCTHLYATTLHNVFFCSEIFSLAIPVQSIAMDFYGTNFCGCWIQVDIHLEQEWIGDFSSGEGRNRRDKWIFCGNTFIFYSESKSKNRNVICYSLLVHICGDFFSFPFILYFLHLWSC